MCAGHKTLEIMSEVSEPARSLSRKLGRRPSMEDVAEVAGVSHQTVSRVVNKKGKVRPETRERVLQAIAELGYRRNEAARSLASNRSRLLGIVTPPFVNFGPATTLLSLQLAANEKGLLVSVAAQREFTSGALRASVEDFVSLGVAGLIVITPVEQLASDLELQDIPVPVLAVASAWVDEQSQIPRIGVDQRAGVYEALKHLKDRGAKTVAHVAGPVDWFDAREREVAWMEGVAELGLLAGPRIQGDWRASSGERIASELASGELPDAILVANDQMAFGIMHAFARMGIRVPEDVLLVGFDDEESSAYYVPALTTVRQDFRTMGAEAIDMLTAMIAGEPIETKTLPSKLKVRQTT